MLRQPSTSIDGPSSPTESNRLRAIGGLVLLAGVLGAGVFFWTQSRTVAPAMDELSAPGYERARERAMGKAMGHSGVLMLGWQDALDSPGTEAAIIVAVAALISLYFFRAAWVLDDDERDRQRERTPPETTPEP